MLEMLTGEHLRQKQAKIQNEFRGENIRLAQVARRGSRSAGRSL